MSPTSASEENSLPESQSVPCQAHPQEMTRLRCTECEQPICPKCMVMYEVGFKCPGCARKRPSHIQQVSGRQFGLTALFSVAIGYVYGWLHPYLMGIGVLRLFGLPILAFFLAYGLGRALGNGLSRVVGSKINFSLGWVAMAGCLMGMFLAGPFLAEVLNLFAVAESASNPYLAGSSSAFYLLGPGLRFLGAFFFLRGLYRAFQP